MTSPNSPTTPPELGRFWQPRHWPVWVGVGLLRLVSLLPVRVQLAVGRGIGALLYMTLPGRRRVAATNLALCFPDWPDAERRARVRQHFASLGMTVIEHGLTWWASDAEVARLVAVRGTEHLKAALATGRGVILLAGHFASQEFTGRIFLPLAPRIGALYRPMKNPFVDAILRRIRSRSANLLIPKRQIRRMIRALREGSVVWYAPDQSYRGPSSALVPFFGEPAMTTTALSEIARLGNAAVIPILPLRLAAAGRYTLEILPPLADFPGESPEADARRVNALIEDHIRTAPEQYYWIHRRFKHRPPPLTDPYRAP